MEVKLRQKIARLIGLGAIIGTVTGLGVAVAIPPRQQWPATVEEVRDEERLNQAQQQINVQRGLVLQRAALRLRYEGPLDYDYSRMVFFVPAATGAPAPVASTAAVESR